MAEMDLRRIEDPNAGVTSRASGLVQVSGARGVQLSAKGAAVMQSPPDPMTDRILESASAIIGTELSKELQKDRMRGALMAAQGASIQEVRENAPLAEQFFGEGATIRGAQAMLIQKAQEDYQLDLMQNMEEYRKMTPEAFREKQVEDFSTLLTGDPATDEKLLLMSQEMFAKGAQEHMKNHLPYVQQEALNSFTSMINTAAEVFDASMEAAKTDEERARLREEMADKMAMPPGMYEGTYRTALATVAVQRMEAGREHFRDMLDYTGVDLDASQLFALKDSEAKWRSARAIEQATEIGVAMDSLLNDADSLKYSDDALVRRMTAAAAKLKGQFAWSDTDVTRVLQRAGAAREAARNRKIENSNTDAWIRNIPMHNTDDSDMQKAADFYLIRSWFSPQGAAQDKARTLDSLIVHNRVNPTLTRLSASAFANPVRGGAVNPELTMVYPLIKAVQNASPQFFDKQFGHIAGELAVFELNGGMSNPAASLVALEQAKVTAVDPEELKRPEFASSKKSAIDAATNGGVWAPVLKMIGNWSGPESDKELAASEVGRFYDQHYKLTRNPDAAAAAALSTFRKQYAVVNKQLVKVGEVPLERAMGLSTRGMATRALEAYINEGNVFGEAGKDLLHGRPVIIPSQGHVSFWATDKDGNSYVKAVPLAQVGAEFKRTRNAEFQASADAEATTDFNELLSRARQRYMVKDEATVRPQGFFRPYSAVPEHRLKFRPGIPQDISDKELVEMYRRDISAEQSVAADRVGELAGIANALGLSSLGLSESAKQLMKDRQEYEETIWRNAQRYIDNPNTK